MDKLTNTRASDIARLAAAAAYARDDVSFKRHMDELAALIGYIGGPDGRTLMLHRPHPLRPLPAETHKYRILSAWIGANLGDVNK